MVQGPDSLPHHNIVDHYPVGSKQPAWVAIFRGGRIFLATNDENHARMFLLGENPKSAYYDYYSIIRHCLMGLVPTKETVFKLEVYAYKNIYTKSELLLNLNPYKIESSDFPIRNNKVLLDLEGLSNFFQKGGKIEGASLDEKKGLILYAKKASKQTIAGHKCSLSDLSVAYRAVFHPGDNEAFISLDPHLNPTKVTVNFGGFLEDTRIGHVVLEADKRFKTIINGLDPNNHKDLRGYTRRFVPSFMSVHERNLLKGNFQERGKWIGTRFWFYPDSIEVETDLSCQFANIVSPQFLADAERSRDDFISMEDFERKKKTSLSPTIRHNIEHLNKNYSKYARAYQELNELTAVARLMGICSWLKNADPSWIDLDMLLSVELPTFNTDRAKTRLIATTGISYTNLDKLDANFVENNAEVIFLSPILDKTIQGFFKSHNNLRKYLCLKNNVDENLSAMYQAEAKSVFSLNQRKKVKDLINSKIELRALADYAANNYSWNSPRIIKQYTSQINKLKKQLEKLDADMKILEAKMKDVSRAKYNTYVKDYNLLVNKYKPLQNKHNNTVDFYNKIKSRNNLMISIGGGINLEAKHFKINKTANSSTLKKFMETAKKTRVNWSSFNGSGNWIKSRSENYTYIKNKLPKTNWASDESHIIDGKNYKVIFSGEKRNYWTSQEVNAKSWRDQLDYGDSSMRERLYDGSTKTLNIVEYKTNNINRHIVGTLVSKDKIVFSKPSGANLIKPKKPPIWWKEHK